MQYDKWILLVSALSAAGAFLCSCGQKAAERRAASADKITATRLDGGPVTIFEYGVKGRTREIQGSSLRRTYVLLNDPTCPVQIKSFSLSTQAPEPLIEQTVERPLARISRWTLISRERVVEWETETVIFDAFNRFVSHFTNGNPPRSGANKDLSPGEDAKTDLFSWITKDEAVQLGDWITSLHFVTNVRTADGKVWSYDAPRIRTGAGEFSLELPQEYK